MKHLLILSPKGGSGKSTIAGNLAVAAALDGLSVATLDTDQQQTLTRWASRRPENVSSIAHAYAPLAEASVAEAELTFDLLVIDTPTAVEEHPSAVKALLLKADLVLVPTQPSPVDVESVVPTMRLVRGLDRQVAFILNRVIPRVRETVDARRELGHHGDVCATDLPHAVEVQRTYSRGLGVLEIRGKVGEDVRSVWNEVRRRLNE